MDELKTFQQVIHKAKVLPRITIAVANAADQEVLEAVDLAQQNQLADFLLFGDRKKIEAMSQKIGLVLTDKQVIHTSSGQESCSATVKSIHSNQADVVMKGMVQTADFLRAILNKGIGLRTEKVLSHVATFEVPHYQRFIHITDPALNIAPSLMEKAQIIENVISYCHALEMKEPKIAVLGAVEVINPNMQATLDAASLTQMFRRRQIQGGIVDGPIALDNAISQDAARHKGIESPVAGIADVLLVPGIEAGNILYKSMVYFAKSSPGAIVLGAKVPIVLTSRTDSAETRLNSIALAVVMASKEKSFD